MNIYPQIKPSLNFYFILIDDTYKILLNSQIMEFFHILNVTRYFISYTFLSGWLQKSWRSFHFLRSILFIYFGNYLYIESLKELSYRGGIFGYFRC